MEQKKRIYRKRIPYGMMNFEDVRKEDCYYVDKTPFIEEMEAANKYFFFMFALAAWQEPYPFYAPELL